MDLSRNRRQLLYRKLRQQFNIVQIICEGGDERWKKVFVRLWINS